MPHRTTTLKLTSADLPIDLTEEVESVLEIDRLWFLDPANINRIQFERRFVPGEELPMKLPNGVDGNGEPFTKVVVQRWGRTFIVQGRPTLMIEDHPPREKVKPKKKDHTPFSLKDFRLFLGKQARRRSESATLTAEEKKIRADAERKRQADRRLEKQQKRNGVRAAKIAKRRGPVLRSADLGDV
jgi:hypothetical protein